MRRLLTLVVFIITVGIVTAGVIFIPQIHSENIRSTTVVSNSPSVPNSEQHLVLTEPLTPKRSCAYIFSVLHPTLAKFNYCNRKLGGGSITLPTNYNNLSKPRQLFVLTNLERVLIGEYPIQNMVSSLNQNAQQAANRASVPRPHNIHYIVYHSVSANTNNSYSLTPVFDWLFQDGYGGGFNTECNSPTYFLCWAHRRAVLTKNIDLSFGAAWHGNASAMVIVSGYIYPRSQVVFTWSDEKRYLTSNTS